MRYFYAAMAVLGTVLPWWFFASFFADNRVDLSAFIGGLFANGAAAGFSTDVILSLLVFWVWSYADQKQQAVRHWWLVFPAGCCVGLSLALPLYLYLRETKKRAANQI